MSAQSRLGNILLYGVGQLGSRYLQGLASSKIPLNIYIYDVSQHAINLAVIRWHEVKSNQSLHTLVVLQHLDQLPGSIDLAIIATTADARLTAVQNIVERTSVRYWILEKVLAQSIEAIASIEKLLSNSEGAWVNTPRRLFAWYSKIKEASNFAGPIELYLSGDSWGLACNSIHYLDLLAWWSGEKLVSVQVSRSNYQWVPSKRPNNWELEGELMATFSSGSTAILISRPSMSNDPIKIFDSTTIVSIDELSGYAEISNASPIYGQIMMQSEITANLVESILNSGKCDLPTFEESSQLHQVFLSEMLDCWQSSGRFYDLSVPIT
jgi:hypothetical protein